MLWAILLTSLPILAQNPTARQVPGVIHVKFTPESIPTGKQMLQVQDLNGAKLQGRFSGRGFSQARKTFARFEPKDTLAVSRLTGEPVILHDLSRWYTIKVADTTNIERFALDLMKLPGVEAASPSMQFFTHAINPNDPRYQSGYQWGLKNPSYSGRDIHAADAWVKNKGRSDVIVAVLDTGVDYNHNDLDPGNRSRIIQGYDAADNDNNPMDDISSSHDGGHGTNVAGVIGAITNNNLKVAGVMWNTKIMPVKIAYTSGPWFVPDNWIMGGIYDGVVADGIDYARQNGADIINMSFGGAPTSGTWYSTFINNPVTEASYNAYLQDVLLVASSGNDDTDELQYPAGFPWVMAVGATDITDQRVTKQNTNNIWGSNYGSHIDVVAPGRSYYTTKRYNSEELVSGTSFSGPMTAGVAGLILSESKDLGLNLTNDDIRQIIRLTADDKGVSGFDSEYGYGRVNADAALTLINSPNIVEHGSKTGGSSTLTWDSHTHTFFRGMGNLASGVYYGVKQYKVTGTVNFSNYYPTPPVVWIRDRTSKGWSYANPNLETPWFKVTNVTSTGFNFETVIYYIGYNSIG